jgi:uncharacterized protein (UPF0332 family)
MPFSWSQYLTLADELAQRTHDAASLRSAISRAYYAVFCSARDLLHAEGVPLRQAGGLHEAVWQAFLTDPRRQRISIGQRGDRLRRDRARADYEANFPRLVEVTAQSVATAWMALRQIQALEMEP